MQGDCSNNDNSSSSSICSSSVSFCPSFNSYASGKLVEIAAKVSQDVDREQDGNDVVRSGGGEDFEFVSNDKAGPDDACELFVDGQIRQVFPLFNRALILNDEDDGYTSPRKLKMSLKNLFIEERGGVPPPSSPSSSDDEEEGDELEGVPEETYCIWSPNRKAVASSPNRSNSIGSTSTSSKGWFKFRDLLKLKRSNSEGKDSFVLVHKRKTNADSKAAKQHQGSNDHVVKAGGGKVKLSPVHENFYMKNRAINEVDKKRSHLPYKQDLLGIFLSNFTSLGKTFAPF